MTKLEWNKVGERFYETGASHGVLYPRTGPGVPWNGLISVNENVSGGEVESLYFDGVKYLDILANEDFQAVLEAYSSPPEFAACDGSKALSPGLFATQQPRKPFSLSYRTLIGNDLTPDLGYKLHLVYNCMASPASRASQTVGERPTPASRQWTINSVPPPASTFKPTAHFVVDSTKLDPFVMADLESYLYGTDTRDPYMPTQDEIIEILSNPLTDPIAATI